MKKLFALLLAMIMCLSAFAGCTQAPAASTSPAAETPGTSTAASQPPAAATEIYFLNFKPEIADVYKTIAEAYEAETGVKVKVTTAAPGTPV